MTNHDDNFHDLNPFSSSCTLQFTPIHSIHIAGFDGKDGRPQIHRSGGCPVAQDQAPYDRSERPVAYEQPELLRMEFHS